MSVKMLYDYIYLRFIQSNRHYKKHFKKINNNKCIDIAICVNKNFITQACVLVSSMINVSSYINLYILNTELDKRSIDYLKENAPINVEIHVIDIDKKELEGLLVCDKWPVEAWARILIPKYIDKELVLYLDADCLIIDDITPLFQIDYSNYLIAGVKSPSAKRRNIEMNSALNGINSGVCMMNLVKMREYEFINKVIDFAKENAELLIMPDQDAINYICSGNILNIDPCYNVMNICIAYSHEKLVKYIDDGYYNKVSYNNAKLYPKIIHFNGGPFERPWKRNVIRVHPYKKLYTKYKLK